MSVPIVRLDALPLRSLGSGNSATIPVVLDNLTTARVPWSDFVAATIKTANSSPASPNSEGQENSIAMSDSGLFYYANGTWKKTPAYSDNWDDLTADARMLLVNKIMSLSKEELDNIYATLQLATATSTKEGLVRAMTNDEAVSAMTNLQTPVEIRSNGTMFVPSATSSSRGTVFVEGDRNDPANPVATVRYVTERIEAIPQATIPAPTSESRGGVLAVGAGGAFVVDDTGTVDLALATEDLAGRVKVTEDIATNLDGVPTATAVLVAINKKFSELGVVSSSSPTTPGLCYPDQKGAWEEYSMAGVGPLFITSPGAIDVHPAGNNVPGVVLVSTDVDAATAAGPYSTVPTVAAVISHVQSAITNQSPTVYIPVASAEAVGGVKVGPGLKMIGDKLDTLSTMDATASSAGVVRIVGSIADNSTSQQLSAAPTAAAVKVYVTSKLSTVAGELNTLAYTINSVATSVASVQGSVRNLESTVSTMNSQLNTLTNRVTTLENKVNSN